MKRPYSGEEPPAKRQKLVHRSPAENAAGLKLNQTLHWQFVQQALLTPDRLALLDVNGKLTYREASARAETIARWLRAQGCRRDEVVGVYLEKSNAFSLGCLACNLAGGAHLILELAYPPEFVQKIIADAKCVAVLTCTEYAGKLPPGLPHLCLDKEWGVIEEAAMACENIVHMGADLPSPESLSFFVYTSGTTGDPKGIANPHRSQVYSYDWRFRLAPYPKDIEHRVACNIFFVWENLRPLLKGAVSVSIPKDVIQDPAALLCFLEEYAITETLLTPSLCEAVLNAADGPDIKKHLHLLRVLWLNGEVVTVALFDRLRAILPHVAVYNLYSISECHEVCGMLLNDGFDRAASERYCPVGPVMEHMEALLLDANQKLVPPGETGELYVTGPLLARGYSDPDITALRFPPVPTELPHDRALATRGGGRMYKTGDLARVLPNGFLEIQGRCDSMVKIRGYSVVLGAVETALLEHIGVKSVAVIAEGSEGSDKRLVCYYVRDPEAPSSKLTSWTWHANTGQCPEIRRRLQTKVPHFMVPACYVEMQTMPIMETTGKLQKKDLPAPPARVTLDLTEPCSVSSRGDVYQHLRRIWAAVLELSPDDLQGEDSFFDLGGHSLSAARLVDKVVTMLQIQMKLADLFFAATLDGLADLLWGRVGQPNTSSVEEEEHDFSYVADATLDASVVPAGSVRPLTLATASTILVTGSTGFLGSHILACLLSLPSAPTIVLLARAASVEAGTARVLEALARARGSAVPTEHAARMRVMTGNLSAPQFGMHSSDYETLKSVEAIIHCAAAVNLFSQYSDLKPSIVDGTRSIVELACSAEPPMHLHHISTNGVLTVEGANELDFPDSSTPLHGGYAQAKWVAEMLVREARARQLPVTVYRPGNMSPPTNKSRGNPGDFQLLFLRACVKAGVALQIPNFKFEMTPVDAAAAAIVALGGSAKHVGGDFHILQDGNELLDSSLVFGWLRAAGHTLEDAQLEEWMKEHPVATERLALRDLVSVLGSALTGMMSHSATKTNIALDALGISKPNVGEEYLCGAFASFLADDTPLS